MKFNKIYDSDQVSNNFVLFYNFVPLLTHFLLNFQRHLGLSQISEISVQYERQIKAIICGTDF